MQLDKTHIAIRERGLLEILDLALHVIRDYGGQLLLSYGIGLLPFLLFNAWLLILPDYYEPEIWYLSYTFWTLLLVLMQMPLAGALTTLYLGQTMFLDRPDWKSLVRDARRSLPQLLLLQGLFRNLLLLPVVTSFLPFAMWAYLTEIILLERNPLRAGRQGISTWRRSKRLHNANAGDIFLRWIAVTLIGGLQVLCLMLALYFVKSWLTGVSGLEPMWYAVFLNISAWSTAFYMTVVRFLCYLDLRIRREGWEVELRMRAEAVRLAEQLS